ncbi:MAG TPA: hypothetical protein VI685_19690 [Candidatus Angelobacter sp.]
MTKSDYKAALAQEQKALAALEHAQRKIEQDILRRRRRIASLIELVTESDERNQEVFKQLAESWVRYNSEQGLTDDVRKIIRSSGAMGIPKEHIRGELSKLGRGIEDHSNPAGTINSIVQRLLDKKEIEEIADPLGLFTILKWKEPDLFKDAAQAYADFLSGALKLDMKGKK